MPGSVALVALLMGCASGPVQGAHLRDAEAPARTAVAPVLSPALAPAPREQMPPPGEVTPAALRNALVEFQFAAQDARRDAPPGTALPDPLRKAWSAALGRVDAFLERPPDAATENALRQAQAIFEAELQRELHAFADIPPELADAILQSQTRMVGRLLELHPPEWTRDPREKFEWPLAPVQVTSLFGRRFHPIERRYKLHAGVDLAAQRGQLVTCAGEGVVVRAGWSGSYGYQVEVNHGGGMLTRYSHLLRPLVEKGDALAAGDAVGLAGSTGESTGPHLHFEVLRRGIALDPLRQLRMLAGVHYRVLAARKPAVKAGARHAVTAPRHARPTPVKVSSRT